MKTLAKNKIKVRREKIKKRFRRKCGIISLTEVEENVIFFTLEKRGKF
jgi:hypothetical protein